MTTTFMCAADRAAYDHDEPTTGQVIAVARKLTSTDWLIITDAFRPGSTVDQRAALLLAVCGPYTDQLDQADLDVLTAVAMPATTRERRTAAVAEVTDWLNCAAAWADAYDAFTVADLLGVDVRCIRDHHAVAEQETDKFRASAVHAAREACKR